MNPFISICIPAYKNVAFLDVLLQSVAGQQFRDFEVVVTDDSPDREVELLCEKYRPLFPLTYQRNSPAAGSPGNWNRSIALAKGQWIKIMHDDDWFSSEDSLGKFAAVAKEDPGKTFIFSGFSNYEGGKLKHTFIPGNEVEWKLKRSPLYLFQRNYIGHPSTTLIKNDLDSWYDEKVKWVVDFEFYIRCLSSHAFTMIRESLINIGISNEQVTKAAFRKIDIEIPENLYLLNKLGTKSLGHLRVYDYYWRLFRNLSIRDMSEVDKFAGGNAVPPVIRRMLGMQFAIPLPLLRIGVFSKMLMLISYISNGKR